MSKISLKHSGGNVVSLNSPTSAPTSADVAFKLPNALMVQCMVKLLNYRWFRKFSFGDTVNFWLKLKITSQNFHNFQKLDTASFTVLVWYSYNRTAQAHVQ